MQGDMDEQHQEKNGPKSRYFEAELPVGARVVCLSGVIGGKKLQTLMAYYS